MIRVRPVLGTNNERQKQSQSGLSGKLKAAKMTMASTGKNQTVNNDRWQNVLQMCQDYSIR
ncbi:MAG: hypothetical protein HRT93_04455 [Piscirickettsiaceae bacterium]|nr:hypothetical protein [Piscirickettsiaceae bacterium]